MFPPLDDAQSQMADGLMLRKSNLKKTKPLEASNRFASYRPEHVLPAPRILLVDDKQDHIDGIERALRNSASTIGKLNCEIIAVRNVNDARSYLRDDSIDLYFLDLEIAEKVGQGINEEIGKSFVRTVVNGTNAGIIVCSGYIHEAPALLEYGADDFVEKPIDSEIIAAKAVAVWRRTLLGRPTSSRDRRQTHQGRTFLLGNWRFVIGNRIVTNKDGGSIRLSITEHAFLRHICVVEDHMINSDILNIEVLERDPHGTLVRLDNFVDRLKGKFLETLELSAQGRSGFYKLYGVQELKPTS
jgi:DNA-binding response OmpR family regulator